MGVWGFVDGVVKWDREIFDRPGGIERAGESDGFGDLEKGFACKR